MVNFSNTVAKEPSTRDAGIRRKEEQKGTLYILHDATVDRTQMVIGNFDTQDDYITSLHLKDL